MVEREEASPGKDAIIFIPGLGRQIVDQRLETIARKLAGALDRQAPRPEPKFKVIGMPDEEYGNSYRARVRAIGVSEPGKTETRSMADLYELDYRDNLTRRFEARNPFSKVLVMVSVLIPIVWRSIGAMKQTGKDLKDKLQMLTMALIMLAVAAFTVMILVAGAQTIKEIGTYGPIVWLETIKGKAHELETEDAEGKALNGEGSSVMSSRENGGAGVLQPGEKKKEAKTTGLPDKITENRTNADELGPKLGVLQALVVLLASLGLFKRESLKEVVSIVATEYVCASNYLRLASQKQLIIGQVMALLEHIAEKSEKYHGVHIVAYSFGTLLAIDSLFPHTRPGGRLTMVKRMITIGCPFDLVRTYWPNYFTQRLRVEGTPNRWINLYTPLDVFGSNFRNDRQRLEAEQGVTLQENETEVIAPDRNIAYDAGLQTEQLNWFDVLMVKGMKLHGGYWTDEEVPELSCLDSIVTELFEGDIALLDKTTGDS